MSGPGAPPRAPRIGIFDSGVGGLTVQRAVLAALPGADTLYLGDTARVPYGTTWLERLEALLARARLVGLALLGLLALGTAVLVSNTLRLAVFARREEIQIMKLVGATDAYVGAPFLVEGLLQGLLGGGLAAGVLLALHAALAPRLAAASGLAALTRSDVLPWPLLLGLALGGGAIGLVASALALARHLRRT